MKPILIGAPFGNYLSSRHAMSTLGTYTLKDRAGNLRWRLLWRIFRTLRWRPGVGGWTNKLGLPNPGVDHLVRLAHRYGPATLGGDRAYGERMSWGLSRIVSLHGFNPEEWYELLRRMSGLGFFGFELNVSCPNVGHLSVPLDLFEKALAQLGEIRVIVKLPPVSYWETFELAYKSGVRKFHATNTLPVPSGGLSGKALKRVSLDVVKRIKDAHPDITVIGGGGITSPMDVIDYKRAGADHFAVASAFLNPINLLRRETLLRELAVAATRADL